jgi:hypothetical protein
MGASSADKKHDSGGEAGFDGVEGDAGFSGLAGRAGGFLSVFAIRVDLGFGGHGD